jgi:hypothetical protein
MKKTISNYEQREREILSFNLNNLKMEDCTMSEIGSFSPWDIKYKRNINGTENWYVSNVKVFKHNSYEVFDMSCWNRGWSSNPIGGHPIKRSVLGTLTQIMYNETFTDKTTYYEVETEFTNYYRPTIIFFFADGIALEWNIDELPLAWDPVSKEYISTHFVSAWNPTSQEDGTLKLELFYGLDPLKATRWDWKEITRPWRGRNEDMISYLNEGEYNEKDLH